jgi:hypothetical protein
MFDKQIADIRVVQILDKVTKTPLSWVLEFRFSGEENWNPVKIQTYEIEQAVTDNEPTSGN